MSVQQEKKTVQVVFIILRIRKYTYTFLTVFSAKRQL